MHTNNNSNNDNFTTVLASAFFPLCGRLYSEVNVWSLYLQLYSIYHLTEYSLPAKIYFRFCFLSVFFKSHATAISFIAAYLH